MDGAVEGGRGMGEGFEEEVGGEEIGGDRGVGAEGARVEGEGEREGGRGGEEGGEGGVEGANGGGTVEGGMHFIEQVEGVER